MQKNTNYLTSRILQSASRRFILAFFVSFLTLQPALFTTPIAHAGVVSYISSLFPAASAKENAPKTPNSQTMALLQAPLAYSFSPSARGGGDISVIDGTALMPEIGPSGSVADLPEFPHATEISVYTVHDGDTLSSIAELFNVSVNTILWANDVTPKTLKKDQVLVILPISGIQHTVGKGDTISTIARKYRADEEEIFQYNGLSPRDTLAVGSVVMVPDAEVVAPVVNNSLKAVKKTVTSTARASASGPRLDGYFGVPIGGGHRTQGVHGYNGVDIGASVGTPVLSSAAGTVIIAKDSGYNGGYGKYVVIKHDNGTQTLYGHMNEVYTSVGVVVPKGQVIGTVGNTGRSTGPHLHFEVRGAHNICADAGNPCSSY